MESSPICTLSSIEKIISILHAPIILHIQLFIHFLRCLPHYHCNLDFCWGYITSITVPPSRSVCSVAYVELGTMLTSVGKKSIRTHSCPKEASNLKNKFSPLIVLCKYLFNSIESAFPVVVFKEVL